MSTLLPKVPVEPLRDDGWPHSIINLRHGACLVCGARWTSYKTYAGVGNLREDGDSYQGRDYPHLAYLCGAVWRDIGNGYWEGQCCAPKTKQLTLNLEADE